MSLPGLTEAGVVVGRFQVPQLHQGHRTLLDLVAARHRRVLVVLGSPAWTGGKNDPLDYLTRELMFRMEYPQFAVAAITDTQSDSDWSARLDQVIKDVLPFGTRVTLYGARDSFLGRYHGRHRTQEVIQCVESSGTWERELTSALPISTPEFRAGVIYGSANSPARMVPCVDGAVLRKLNDRIQVILIKKPGELRWRFPGGKLDPEDQSLEAAVSREVREETGVEVGNPVYVTSGNLPDWRAVAAGITIHSSLFVLPYVFGAPKGGDDAATACFRTLKSLDTDDMEACHKNLLATLQSWVYTTEAGHRFEHDFLQEVGVEAKSSPSNGLV